jgi:Cu/Ag efflux protein CusF
MKSHRSFVPALAGVLVAFGVTAAPAPAIAQLTGHVKSVDTAANKLILTETGTGTDYVIAVNGRTLVVTREGKPLTLKDLRKGDGLAVNQIGGVASKIVAEQPRLVGIVKSVDAEAKKLVLREGGAKGEAGTGKDITMTVDGQTAITTTDGKSIKLGDLKEGDGVSIAHAGDLAQKIDVDVKPDELTGFVKSVGADLKSFVVTLTGTTKDVTVVVNGQTTIVTTEGKTLKVKELKEGDGVGVAHTASVAKKIVVNVKPLR